MNNVPTTCYNAHSKEQFWSELQHQAKAQADTEPVLSSFLYLTVSNHSNLACAQAYHLANKLDSAETPALVLKEQFESLYSAHPELLDYAQRDLIATYQRDSACTDLLTPFLYYKGFHALQAWRLAHKLWLVGRKSLALLLQHRISVVFCVDIHPAARIGSGIMFDHGTGIVIGETAVVEDDVSIMQAVTLGGTGKESGDRHPKVRKGVLISAGAKILGNIELGEGSRIGTGSVVLKPVEPHTTVTGVPAKKVDCCISDKPAEAMDHGLD